MSSADFIIVFLGKKCSKSLRVLSVTALPFVPYFLERQVPPFPPAAETTHRGVSERSLFHTLVNSSMNACHFNCNISLTAVP